jgi:putative sigma-54 modulation protein
MQVKVHSVHFNADQKLINFIKKKLEKLDQFHDNIIGAEVFLKVENRTDFMNKITEIKLNLPGKELFAKKKECKSFEEATDGAVDALRRQIKKHKGKITANA